MTRPRWETSDDGRWRWTVTRYIPKGSRTRRATVTVRPVNALHPAGGGFWDDVRTVQARNADTLERRIVEARERMMGHRRLSRADLIWATVCFVWTGSVLATICRWPTVPVVAAFLAVLGAAVVVRRSWEHPQARDVNAHPAPPTVPPLA